MRWVDDFRTSRRFFGPHIEYSVDRKEGIVDLLFGQFLHIWDIICFVTNRYCAHRLYFYLLRLRSISSVRKPVVNPRKQHLPACIVKCTVLQKREFQFMQFFSAGRTTFFMSVQDMDFVTGDTIMHI